MIQELIESNFSYYLLFAVAVITSIVFGRYIDNNRLKLAKEKGEANSEESTDTS